MFAFPVGGPKSKKRNKHCWYVRNNDYLTAEKIREVSQLRLAVVDSPFFSFLFHANPPTANDGFRLFTRSASFRVRPRQRVEDPRADALCLVQSLNDLQQSHRL